MIGAGDIKIKGTVEASGTGASSSSRKPTTPTEKVGTASSSGSRITGAKPAAPRMPHKTMLGSTRWAGNPGTTAWRALSLDQRAKRLAALNTQADAKLRKGDLEGAAELYSDVIALDHRNGHAQQGLIKVAKAYAKLGKTLYAKGKYAAAAEKFQLARMYDTNNTVATHHLRLIAQICAKRGKKMYDAKDFAGAKKEFELAQNCDPTNRMAKHYLPIIRKILSKSA